MGTGWNFAELLSFRSCLFETGGVRTMTTLTTLQSPTASQYSEIINRLVMRIVEIAHPLRIILFGSAARGELQKDSDIDVMVVMPDGTHRFDTTRYLYRKLSGFGFPVDIVVATPSVLETHKDTVGLIYRSALREGTEVYVA